MGGLEVQILKEQSNTAGRDAETYTAKYASPFFGYTPFEFMGQNDGSKSTIDGFNDTQKSYGMWFVPPDVGVNVLVIFVDSDESQCYWFACVPGRYINNMVPAIAGSTNYQLDSVDRARYGSMQDGNGKPLPLPVAEINKRHNAFGDTNGGAREIDPEKIKRVVHPMADRFLEQGLLRDDVRGVTTSSARRSVPSSVFGISTPGPVDRRTNAKKAKIGKIGDTTEPVPVSRLGGTQLVMDDGDDRFHRETTAAEGPVKYLDLLDPEVQKQLNQGAPTVPYGEYFRVRTRTGHQILMHNSEDLIYIANARGTTWIEMTSNGKIDIFAQDSISIRTAVDVNLSADRDLNFTAARDINFNAGRDYKLTVTNNSDVIVGVNHVVNIGANHDLLVGANQKLTVVANNDIVVGAANKITTGGTLDIATGGARKDSQASFDVNSSGDNKFSSGADTSILSGGNHIETAARIDMNSTTAAKAAASAAPGVAASQATPALWPVRVPEHEPWKEHEHFDPARFQPSQTQASTSPSPVLRNAAPLINGISDEEGSGANTASEARVVANQKGDQVIVPGKAGPIGDQPANPVPITQLQRYFLGELIKILGLNPATCLKSANPADLAPGETPGNAQALGMALGQIEAECGFRPRNENLNYSAKRLREVFPSRVRSDEFAQQLAAAGPVAIGNTLYGGRLGNGPDEGYKYRGRGLIGLTFKANYITYGRQAGVPQILENPDLVNDPPISTKLAVSYLKTKSVSWTGFNFNSLGEQFRLAVGYADRGGAETIKRIGLGKGFTAKLLNGTLTPISSLST
jgi:hypothetical protein